MAKRQPTLEELLSGQQPMTTLPGAGAYYTAAGIPMQETRLPNISVPSSTYESPEKQNQSDQLQALLFQKQMEPKTGVPLTASVKKQAMQALGFEPQTHEELQDALATKSALTGMDKQSDSMLKFHEGQWEKINRSANPAVAYRGSALGIAAQAQMRANRADANLNDPEINPQKIDAVVVDLAGIMQGGSPHESSIARQRYGNIWEKFASFKSSLMGEPVAVRTPKIVAKLRQTINDIREVDNKVISDNLRTIKTAFQNTTSKDPARWNEFKNEIQAYMNTVSDESGLGPVDASGAAPATPATPAAPPVETTKYTTANAVKEAIKFGKITKENGMKMLIDNFGYTP